MESVLIDTFVIPEESEAAFLSRAGESQAFVKTLPGFVEGFVYRQRASEGRLTIMTVAVWESDGAVERALTAVAEWSAQQGIDRRAFLAQHGIAMERARCTRAAY